MRASRFAGRFLIPGGVWLLFFFAVPLGIVLAISFGTTDELGGAIYGWYPSNYSRVFDPVFVPVLIRSVGYALATVALCLLVGYPVAYYIARFGGRHKHALIALVIVPSFVNYLVRTYASPTRGWRTGSRTTWVSPRTGSASSIRRGR
jgi:spermidine/putrescine transport system permease protein